MSFFDEADEPVAEPRTAPRQRRPSGGGRLPPSDQQAIRTRRFVAGGVIAVLVIIVVFLVHSCQVSQLKTSLKDYANGVSNLNQQSTGTAKQVFNVLSSGGGSANATTMSSSLIDASATALRQFNNAHGLDVPDQMKAAQQNFLLAMQMRHDAAAAIASKIEQALGTTTRKDAINQIAADMNRYYSSDTIYKDYTTGLINNALTSNGIAVGANGVQLDLSQSLPDLGWLTPEFVANKLGVTVAPTSTTAGPVTPGTHGHSLDSVSVGGVTLQTGSTNTLPASPPPTFTLSFTNSGQNNETNVVCKVSVGGTKITGTKTVAQTTTGQSTTCAVALSSSPPAGNYTVTATIVPVRGEKTTSNNTLTFPVTFQ